MKTRSVMNRPLTFRLLSFRWQRIIQRLTDHPSMHPILLATPLIVPIQIRNLSGSARIIPLWLSCSPKPSCLFQDASALHHRWANSVHHSGPVQSSEITAAIIQMKSLSRTSQSARFRKISVRWWTTLLVAPEKPSPGETPEAVIA